MKTIFLMRHAKSSWKKKDLPDLERPLNKRGEKDASRMGKLLEKQDLHPGRIVSSTAIRASLTAEIVAKKLDYKDEIDYLPALYQAESDTILAIFRSMPEDIDTALIISHNPGIEMLIQIISDKVESFPTGAIAQLEFDVQNWADIQNAESGKMTELWRPKDLK